MATIDLATMSQAQALTLATLAIEVEINKARLAGNRQLVAELLRARQILVELKKGRSQ